MIGPWGAIKSGKIDETGRVGPLMLQELRPPQQMPTRHRPLTFPTANALREVARRRRPAQSGIGDAGKFPSHGMTF
jgi:hypothetical protein